MIENRTDILYPVKDLTSVRGVGFTAWCENRRVMLGTRAMMEAEDVGVPARDYEERYTEGGKHQALYLAVSGQLFAMFVIQYRGSQNVKNHLDALVRKGIGIVVDSDEPSITAERVALLYKMPAGTVKVLNQEESEDLAPARAYAEESECCMTHTGTFVSFAGGLEAVEYAVGAQKNVRTVSFGGSVLALLLAVLLTLAGSMAGFSLPMLILYQLLWCLLPLVANFLRHG